MVIRENGLILTIGYLITEADDVWITSRDGRKVLYEMDVFGGGTLEANYRANSPCESTIYPQVRLEPLMRERAESMGTGKLMFNCSLVSLEQDTSGVTARVESRDTGEIHTVRARYLVAADGGKSVGSMVGGVYIDAIKVNIRPRQI